MGLMLGDCLEVLKTIPDNSIDSLVTDPPAGISFMGKHWDDDKGGKKNWIAWLESVAKEVLRVLKPGAHGLVWSLPRTSHWTATALEDAGFEVRDCITHLFGSGFPKSLDISKAIDKAAGAKREVVGKTRGRSKSIHGGGQSTGVDDLITAPSTDAAKQWQGFGTALKPAAEFYWLVRKPLAEKTVAANVLKWGVGGLNIDQTRIKPCDAIVLQKNRSSLTLPNVYADILESLPDSFDAFCALSLSTVQDFVTRTFSVLDFDSITDKGFWRGVEREYRSLRNQQSGALCDYGPFVEHVTAYAQDRLRLQDSQSYYPILSHFYDGLFHATEANAQDVFPSLDDVREYIFSVQQAPKNTLLSDNSLHLFCVWVFAWCLYKAILHDNQSTGRFPANLVLSHSPYCTDDQCDLECAIKRLNEQSGISKSSGGRTVKRSGKYEKGKVSAPGQWTNENPGLGDVGGASRFFYCPKVSPSERGDSTHPTMKAQKLMRYLCRLVTPPGGTVLDCFMGSGSTGLAALAEGFEFIGIEKEPEYFEIAKARIENQKNRV